MPASPAEPVRPKLRRRLTLPLVVLYGLGVTIGAGIYVLIGATAAEAGMQAPFAFILAAFVMGFSAATFSEFVGRLPVSAGEAAYVQAGFGSRTIALVVGSVVMLAGIVSSATISIGSAGYIGAFLAPWAAIDPTLLTVMIVLVVGAIASVGILESVAFAGLMTLVEVGGLIAIIAGGFLSDAEIGSRLPELLPQSLDFALLTNLLGAGLLAFFAFIGFEDMVNVAEEVRDPTRTMPRAIFLTLIIATLLYVTVVSIAVLSVPLETLAGSDAPLGLVFGAVTSLPAWTISAIATIATVNGIVIQVIMASRVLYGMGDQGTIPGALGRGLAQVSAKTGTPLVATGAIVAIVITLALTFELEQLAALTSQLILCVFVAVNLALARVKWRERGQPSLIRPTTFRVPIAVPIIGASLSALLVIFGG